uniref:Uncharacterized protein n=1 Tax=Amphimedon queenslandica TaxID=400682 RepID=A0A1X7UKJ4_AMPQE
MELSYVWDINDHGAQRIHQRVGEMISIDNQSFSKVTDVGFACFLKAMESRYYFQSHKYFTEPVIPRIYIAIEGEVRKEIAGVKWFSFTTDIWSTSVSNDSLLSLTAHWLNNNFKRKSAVLNTQTLHEAYICSQYKDMLKHWNIEDEQIQAQYCQFAIAPVLKLCITNYYYYMYFTNLHSTYYHSYSQAHRKFLGAPVF